MSGVPDEVLEMYTPEFWDARYSSTEQVWSGKPNPRLVEYAADLTAGSALDVGSGEGADAIWLASGGWHVTGLDVSQVALDRAAAHAADVGGEVADRITWWQTDLTSWTQQPAGFDLVSAHFLHFPRPLFEPLYRKLAAAVRPGGTLLVAGHNPSEVDASEHPEHAALLFTSEQVAAILEPGKWEIVAADDRVTLVAMRTEP